MSAPMTTTTTGARALVERTTMPRGLPVCVEDPVVLSRLATLLASAEDPARLAPDLIPNNKTAAAHVIAAAKAEVHHDRATPAG